MTVLLDITRTIARARLAAPTGIDRVERAYIDWALGRGALFLGRIDRRQHVIGPDTVRRLTGWLDGESAELGLDLRARLRPDRDERLRRAQALIRREAVGTLRDFALPRGGVYLNTGHDNLEPRLMQALAGKGLRRVALLHDVIPLDHPGYARAGTPEAFRTKLVAALMADGVIFNSAHTAARVAAHAAGPVPRSVTAPLGIEPARPVAATPASEPYFIVLGTIEPRKNHALLLRVWQGLDQGENPPHLHILGRRGWENRAGFDVLDTHPMVGRSVHELGPLDDDAMRAHIGGARALLFPSFAEGFGLPLAEALAAGCPVIASDLPALREVGGDVPEWLAPDDQMAWQKAIQAYACEPSHARDGQLARMGGWRPPRWETHFKIVENLLETILVQAPRGG